MVIDQLGSDGRYTTRLLEPSDLRALQALFERSTDYFELVTGAPPRRDEAAQAYVAGPPTKQVHAKRIIGIFAGGQALVGVIDALTDWPHTATWSMGILLIDPAHRRQGLGTAVLHAYEQWAKSCGARRLRTAVVAHHDSGIRFLERAGYQPDGQLEKYEQVTQQPTVRFYSKHVG